MIAEDIFSRNPGQGKSLDILPGVRKKPALKTESVFARFSPEQFERLERVLEKRNRRAGEYVRIATMISVEADLACLDSGAPLPEMGDPPVPARPLSEHSPQEAPPGKQPGRAARR